MCPDGMLPMAAELMENFEPMETSNDGAGKAALSVIACDLQQRLEAAFAGIGRRHASVAVSLDGDCRFAMVSDRSDKNVEAFPFRTGCLTKLLTAALVEEAIEKGKFARNTLVQDVLTGGSVRLGGVAVGQLNEHTHGLDLASPLSADGCERIDLESLLAAIKPQALPGDLYSYSNVGAWLAAAMLERVETRSFAALLTSQLFAPTRMRWSKDVTSRLSRDDICPAVGAGLVVSVGDMLRFLTDSAIPRARQWPRTLTGITALPGWHPLEQGIYRGWKFYGEGWYGHDSTWPRASALVRMQPQARIAIVIASAVQPVAAIGAKLFAKVLPEYRSLRVPRAVALLGPLERYCSCYGHSERVAIECRSGKGLSLIGCDFAARLDPAEHDIFFVRPPKVGRYSFVQFLRPHRRGYEYLWNGQRVSKQATA